MSPHRTRLVRTLSALLLAAGVLSAASAVAKESSQHSRIRPIPARAIESVVDTDRMSVGVESGVPRSLANENYRVRPADPETMARQYLSENASKLRLSDAGLGDLFVRAIRTTPAGTTVRFEQRVGGIPVLAPDVAVTIDPASKVTFVMNGYEPGVSIATNRTAMDEEAATQLVIDRLGVTDKPAFEKARLVVVPDGKSARLAYDVRVVPSTEPHGDWQGLVDANNGELFRLQDISLHVDGSGHVFDPDPLAAALATYGQPGYTDAGDADSPQLTAARSLVTLRDITDMGGGNYKLQGPWATIVDTESPFKGLFIQAGTNFQSTRANDLFEATNCYYHVDHMMRFINVTLGIPVVPFQYAGGVRFDPSGLSGADNAHYTPSSGVIAFGEGGVDDAEDGGVVIHELGHGLHDWLTVGSLSQVNGLSEGTGDYIAASYARSKNQWTPADAPYQWTFRWDGHNEFWPGRITNYGALYPGGLTGAIHTDGQIWATCLMRIWNLIGRNKMDKALYAGLAMTNSSTNQNQAAQAVLQAAISMGYTSAEIGAMASEMRATGYTVSVGVDYVSNAITDECTSHPGNVNGVLEPGEAATVRVTLVAPSVGHTGVSGVLSSTTPGITVIDGYATWPDLAPGVPTQSDAPHFRILVDRNVACLSTATFQLSVTTNQGGPFVSNFTRPIGSSLTPSGLPLAITDNLPAGVNSTLNVPTAQILTDVNVRVAITHTWVGDLKITLRSPAGTVVTLLDRPGVPASTFGCSNDNMNVTFDDAGSLNLETHCAGTNPWYVGVALPASALSAFNGQSSLGDWVLNVSDNAGADTGTLTAWELITSPPLAGTCNVCDAVVSTRLAMFVAEDKVDGIEVAWELADRGDVTGVSLERASAQVGPWEPVVGEYATDGSRTAVLDRTAQTDQTYFYRLRVNERDGSQSTLGLVAARHSAGAIRSTMLLGASPNPAGKNTTLAFRLSQSQFVHLSVVDAQGRRLRTLAEGTLPVGEHARFWDGLDENGKVAPAGMYFGVLHTSEGRQSSRFVLMR